MRVFHVSEPWRSFIQPNQDSRPFSMLLMVNMMTTQSPVPTKMPPTLLWLSRDMYLLQEEEKTCGSESIMQHQLQMEWYTVHHADYEFVRKNVHLICRCINLFMRETKCNSYNFTLLGHICQFYGRALRRDPLEHILPFPCTLQAPASALGHCLGIHQS